MSIRARRAARPGITFRSLLECRWSAALDSLGLPWEFEPTHFDLPGGMYIPDFHVLPDSDRAFWIEVKGPWPNAREFEVASEVNLYHAPLMILSGDIPRQPNGGTAWWFDEDTHRWSMLRPEEALIRVIFRYDADPPESLGEQWGEALEAARHEELIRVVVDM